MNHLIFLDPRAGELEKILSGIKTMVLKEFDHSQPAVVSVSPGDSLYFLKNQDEYAVRVKAIVVRVLPSSNNPDEDLSHNLKEMQPKLQLNEAQYSYWSAKKQALLVEFEPAYKIDVIYVAPNKITDKSEWIAFEKFSWIT